MHGAGGAYDAEGRPSFLSVEGYHCIGQLAPPPFGTSMSHRGVQASKCSNKIHYVHTCTCRYHYNDTGHSYQ